MKFFSNIPVVALLAVSTVLLLLPWFNFCFDYADIGWNATKAWMIVEHPESAFWEFSWLSSMMGGLVMKATGYSIFWLRIGMIVAAVATVLFAYALLRQYYQPRESGLALIPIFLLYLSGHQQFILTYYEIPLLFSLPAAYFHLKSFAVATRRSVVAYSLCGGVCFAGLVQSRIPSVIFGSVFLVTALIERGVLKRRRNWLPRLIATFIGFLIGTGIIALVLYLSGDLHHLLDGLRQTYIDAFSNNGNDNIHNPLRLLKDTAIRYGKMLGVGSMALLAAYVWRRFYPKREPSLRDPLTVLSLFVVAACTALFFYKGLGGFPPSFGIMSILFLFVLWRQRRDLHRERLLLYTLGVFHMIFLNAGASNDSVWSFKFSAWIIMPVALIESSSMLSERISIRLLRWVLYMNVTVVMITGRIFNEAPVYRMNVPFQAETLYPMHGTAETVEEFEKLMSKLRTAGLRPGDTALCYVDIPIIHFATRTIPALRNAWISDHALVWPSYETMRRELRRRVREHALPKIVVRSFSDRAPATPKTLFLDSLWGAQRYDTAWRNEKFIVLKRPY